MRMLVFLVLNVVSLSCFAEAPSFWPKQVTCEQIQTAMTRHGRVGINVKYLLGTETYPVYPHHINCEFYEIERKMKVRTLDGLKCFVGYYCDERIEP